MTHTDDLADRMRDAAKAIETVNHGCRFEWCENPSAKWEAHRLEHFQAANYVPATGNSLAETSSTDLPTVGVSVSFNEDIEPAPTICLYVQSGSGSGRDCVLRIDEAVLLYDALGKAIINACKGTNLSPKRITAFYSREAQ